MSGDISTCAPIYEAEAGAEVVRHADGINGVFEALRKNQEKIRFIHVRHEEAAFMACAYAKFTGRLARQAEHRICTHAMADLLFHDPVRKPRWQDTSVPLDPRQR